MAIYTDKLDGDIARSRGLITDFGKIADPIADKLLIGSALVMLSVLRELPWWVTILMLVREWGITALRFLVIRYGVIPASRGGKLKTVVQTVAIFLYVIPLASLAPWLGVVAFAVMMAAAGHHGLTGVEYVVEALKLRAGGIRAQKQTGRGRQAMTSLHPNLHRLAEQAVTGAIDRGLTVATAESLTAGMVAAVLADTPGASGMLQGGVVAYQNSVKAGVLGVPAELLDAVGAVDAQVAAAMAEGARRICGADIGVSTTGVAGPEPHDGKAVGTVFIGVATAEGSRPTLQLRRGPRRKSAPWPAARPWSACSKP